MPVSPHSNSNTKPQSYVPPSLKHKNTAAQRPTHLQQQQSAFASSSTKKTELKKEFSLADAFPTLGETIKPKNAAAAAAAAAISAKKSPISSFSSVASKKNPEKKDTTTTEPKLLPGWVYIRKYNGKIEYKHGASIINENELELAYQENQRLGKIIFKYRLVREQYQRDMDIERLGDLSEFYGEPTLIEMYDNDSNLHFNEDDMNSSDNDY